MTKVRRSGAPRRVEARIDTSKEGSQGRCIGGVGGYGTIVVDRGALLAHGIAEGSGEEVCACTVQIDNTWTIAIRDAPATTNHTRLQDR